MTLTRDLYVGNTVVRIDGAESPLDVALCLWQRGWPNPHNQRPEPIVEGVERWPAPALLR